MAASTMAKPAGVALSTACVLIITFVLFRTYQLVMIEATNDGMQSEHAGAKPLERNDFTKFQTIPVLEDMSDVGDEAWATLLPSSDGGFLWVRYNETMKTGWGMTMFHALHCLQMVRSVVKEHPAFAESVEHMSHTHSGGNTHHEPQERHEQHAHAMDYLHVSHCLSYIAQSLLCSADGTLEPPKLIHDENGNLVRTDINGEGVEHVCRDRSSLWEMAKLSEKAPLEAPDWRAGDTIQSIFEKP